MLVSLSLIAVDAEANPRRDLDPEALHELFASVKQHGVLQPILVRDIGGGQEEAYQVVAGYRRLAAAHHHKLAEVPVHVLDADVDVSAAALVENLVRSDLSPVDEARGLQQLMQARKLTQAKAAKVVGRSAAYVSERLALLKLPVQAQEAIGSGKLPPSAGAAVAKLAAQSPALAAAVVDAATTPDAARELVANPGKFLDRLEFDPGDEAFCVRAGSHGGGFEWRGLAFTDEQAELITASGVDEIEASGKERVLVSFTHEDVDAARAFGALLEYERDRGWEPERFVTNEAWLCDRVVSCMLPRAVERWHSWHPSSKAAKAKAAAASGKTDEEIKVAKDLARQAAKDEREEADRANKNLGAALFGRGAGTSEAEQLAIARVLAAIVYEHHAEPLTHALVLSYEGLNPSGVKTGKAYLADCAQNGAWVYEQIDKAETVGDVMAVMLRAMVAAVWVDQSAIPQGARRSWFVPGSHAGHAVIRETTEVLRGIGFEYAGEHLRQRIAQQRDARDPGGVESAVAAHHDEDPIDPDASEGSDE